MFKLKATNTVALNKHSFFVTSTFLLEISWEMSAPMETKMIFFFIHPVEVSDSQPGSGVKGVSLPCPRNFSLPQWENFLSENVNGGQIWREGGATGRSAKS